ncbi:MAG: GxxExxY protein [Planctomycetota bacterium]|jgi:GxxExxY protein
MNHETHEHHEKCYAIQGAIFDVYREMGCGFLEAVYQECLLRELQIRKIPCMAQPVLQLSYKGQQLEQVYRPDFVCYDKVILELKAVKDMGPEHKAQVINYLKATDMKLGLLVNFGAYPKATICRLAL